MEALKEAYLQWKHSARTLHADQAPADGSRLNQGIPVVEEEVRNQGAQLGGEANHPSTPPPVPEPEQEAAPGFFEVTAIWTHCELIICIHS